jgi:hypothetical protein
MQSFVCPV